MADLQQFARAVPGQPEDSLGKALTAQSPRRSPPPTPLASRAIHMGVLVLWVLLLGAPFGLHGVFVWSAGLLYVAYDTLLLVLTFCLTLPLLVRRTPSPRSGSKVSLAVIVAAKNEALVLPATLSALLSQSEPPDRILIVDDGSTDATPEVLAKLYGLRPPPLGTIETSHPKIHWLRLAGGGKARAMNTALPLLDEDIVLTVDADTLLQADAIAVVRQAFATEPNLVAATGILTPVCANTPSGRVFEWFQTYEYIRNFLSRYAWMRLNSLLLISGAFAGFRRAAALEVGGFDPDCLVEDYELIHRLKRYGVLHGRSWTTRVLGGAQAQTEAPSTPLAFLRQRRRWFGGFLQTQYWYRDMVGNRRYGALGLAMLPVKAIDTLQPVYGLTAFVLLCTYLAQGRLSVLAPVGGVIGAKILVDFSFQLWALYLYRRWLGDKSAGSFGHAFLASLIEPFTFQILRHIGAIWGWAVFLSGRQTWGSQKRVGALT
ncbi:glycosyltransferase family 2 protein [Caulobacter sp. S45]|uniref:glycosyltransferase family 2 protein n=1 Tax=Caulobacter sp. S45 TaxID=1641861 RepID=UPI00131BA691|nr:glycosyltransferase [Caulobacter sp. S45]